MVVLALASCSKVDQDATPVPKPAVTPPTAPSEFSIKVISKHWNERSWYAVTVDAVGAVTFHGDPERRCDG